MRALLAPESLQAWAVKELIMTQVYSTVYHASDILPKLSTFAVLHILYQSYRVLSTLIMIY